MQPDAATKRGPGRPVGWRKYREPSIADRMADALRIWRCDFNDADAVAGVLRLAGFSLMDIARHVDEAIAAVRPHPGRRLP